MENKSLTKGIICIIFSAFSFAVMGMLVHLAGPLPFVQKAFFRNIMAFFIAFTALLKKRRELNFPKGGLKYLLIRSIGGSVGIFGNFYALDHINIADAAILNKMSPFFAVIFSFFLVKETIKPVPFLATAGAFLGALFVIKPSIHFMDSLPAVLAFLGGMGAGLAYSTIRKLSSMKMTGEIIIAFFSLFSSLIAVPFIILNFEPMTLRQLIILLGTGLAATCGQFGITYAYYFAAARDISVYDYSQIIFSASLGFIFFRQIPDFYSLLGYSIIILMAVIVFIYNRRKIH